MVHLRIKRLHENAQLPHYKQNGDAGMDLYAIEDAVVQPNTRKLFKLGFAMQFDPGHVALIWDRSGLAAKNGITALGGVIDHTYRGEVGVILYNTSDEPLEVKKGHRIAQMLIQPIHTARVEEVDELSQTTRGEGGFGSSGR